MKKLKIVHLYPREMNIYGDTGNTLILQRRLEWRGFKPEIEHVGAGNKLPKDIDIIIGGGGQDSGQVTIQEDLMKKTAELKAMGDDGVAMLMICGMYQLFGHHFLTIGGEKLKGIGYFDLVTVGGPKRFIGNIRTRSHFGHLVGYENHSGLTNLAEGQRPLAQCKKGQGNNGRDRTEGAIKNNVLGSYLHGPILSKNPVLADELLSRAINRRYGEQKLESLDDKLENSAAEIAAKLTR